MRQADHIREYALENLIEPARSQGQGTVTVRAGDVHREMQLSNAMPAVCSALDAKKFLEMASAELIDRCGPPEGSNALFTFKLLGEPQEPITASPPSNGKTVDSARVYAANTLPNLSNALCLVSCVSVKLDHRALAKELYISPLFKMNRKLVETLGADWRILSALHGLVEPEAELSPYDLTLNNMRVGERREWAAKVLADLIPLATSYDSIVFLAGKKYREFLIPELEQHDLSVEIPMEGLAIGKQLQWLRKHL